MCNGYGSGMGWGLAWMWTWPVLALLGLVLLGVLAYVLPGRGRVGGVSSGDRGARELLDQRFVRGEIDAEEYRQRVAELLDPRARA